MVLFFVLFMADYLLTYIGLNAGYIIEANPFMQNFMSLGLVPGTILRTLIAIVICSLFNYIKKNDVKAYKKLIGFIVMVLVLVMGLHSYWIYQVSIS
ncbi:MAG TPA: hypothetical protein DDZ89_09175 [Clostridiales bacterium]|nr:hypothetical protein [Clostridiales bacterium]